MSPLGAELQPGGIDEYFPASSHPWAAALPYNLATIVGDVAYLGGHAPIGPEGKVVQADFETQLRQCYSNIEGTLKSVGSDFSGLVRITAMLTDRADYEVYRRVREEILSPPYPATAAYIVDDMTYEGMRVGLVGGVAIIKDRDQAARALAERARMGGTEAG